MLHIIINNQLVNMSFHQVHYSLPLSTHLSEGDVCQTLVLTFAIGNPFLGIISHTSSPIQGQSAPGQSTRVSLSSL